MAAHWRAMVRADLVRVEEIGHRVHPAYPESADVPRERLELFPAGCFVAGAGDAVQGYAVAHPGILGQPPRLDTLLGTLPAMPDCLYLHDMALLPAIRGQGLPPLLLARLRFVAAAIRLPRLALVAVNRSAPYWRRLGFAPLADPGPALAGKLASYGGDAEYLVAEL